MFYKDKNYLVVFAETVPVNIQDIFLYSFFFLFESLKLSDFGVCVIFNGLYHPFHKNRWKINLIFNQEVFDFYRCFEFMYFCHVLWSKSHQTISLISEYSIASPQVPKIMQVTPTKKKKKLVQHLKKLA